MKFNIQDRIVLDEMVDTFTAEMNKTHDNHELMEERPIITREYWLQMIEVHDKFEEEGKRPIIMKNYWLQMIKEVQRKIDDFTTVKALNQSKKYR